MKKIKKTFDIVVPRKFNILSDGKIREMITWLLANVADKRVKVTIEEQDD